MLPGMNVASGPDDALGLVGITIDQVRFDACVDAGGFGLIYKGYHEGLGEAVAIKCLRIQSIQRTNEAIREALAGRFRDETKLLYRLSQGNLDIVRCISSGSVVAPKSKEYTPYMVLEWLDGQTLSGELRDRRNTKQRPRTLDGAVALLDSAAGALAYAHANDVVHRDVKPGNLFLTRTREGVRMKVLDFGLAKILSDESIGVRPSVETGVGVHFCSPSYGAPEQFSATIGKIGPWTDVYSLTLVLYEIMLGDKVRPAATLAEGLVKAVDKKTGSPSASSLGLHVPKAVEELLLRALAQNPLERPRDAGSFWASLKAAIASSPKPNLANATVMDDSVGQAMLEVRAAVARASMQPAPFTGTMLMQNAPPGAPHLVEAVPGVGTSPPHGGSGGTQPTEPPMMPRSVTAPLKPPDNRLKGTLPIGAVSPLSGLSPLAASMAAQAHHAAQSNAPASAYNSGPPPMSALPQSAVPQSALPHSALPQHQQQQQPQPTQPPRIASQSPGDMRVSAPPQPPMARSSAGSTIFIVLCLLLAVAGITFYVVRMTGH